MAGSPGLSPGLLGAGFLQAVERGPCGRGLVPGRGLCGPGLIWGASLCQGPGAGCSPRLLSEGTEPTSWILRRAGQAAVRSCFPK